MTAEKKNRNVRADFSYLRFAWRNFTFYLKRNTLFCISGALCTVILIGALSVGASLKTSLQNIKMERLGKIEWMMNSQARHFNAMIADSIRAQLNINAAAIFSLVGTVGIVGTNEQVHRVNIIGVDENFWKLAPSSAQTQNIASGTVAINSALAKKLNSEIGDEIILRFQNTSALNLEAPFGMRENSTAHRLKVSGIIDKDNFGDFSLRAEHFTVYNVFVPIEFMQKANNLQEKANTILIGKFANINKVMIINTVQKSLQLSDAGLNIRIVDSLYNTMEIYSDNIFISGILKDKIADVIPNAVPVSSWFVNEIRNLNSDSVTPYSFVSSMPKNFLMNDNEIMLSQWTADDLNAKVGDTIAFTYFVPRQTSGLRTDTATFVLSAILSDTTQWLNSTLAPPYPGLAGAESCADWDPSIPVDLSKIRQKDEDFWYAHEGTPKAIISYNRAEKIWNNRFGVTTAIRIDNSAHEKISTRDIENSIQNFLTPALCGMQLTNVRGNIATAINNGINFAPLFLGLSFFTLAASLMLIWLMSSLQITSRAIELKMLRTFGYSKPRVLSIYITEGLMIFLAGTAVGIIISPLYTYILIYALRTVWQSAALVPNLTLHIDAPSIIYGGALSFVCALMSMLVPALSIIKRERPKELSVKNFPRNKLLKMFSKRDLLMRNVTRNKKHLVLEIAILACALFVLGITQLFHQTPLSNVRDRTSESGGFYYYGELNSGIPLEETTAQFLRERGVDIADEDFISVAMRVKDGDDASCLNLNQTQTPALVGVPQKQLDSLGAFSFAAMINVADKKRPWKILSANANAQNTIYAVVDANTIEWGLGKKLGDTLTYINEQHDTLHVIIAAALKNSILQGRLLIAETDFIKHFPSVSGYRILLLSPPADLEKKVADAFLLAHGKSGLTLEQTLARLNTFNAVENTYLSIFAILGIFGLALGCAGQGIIIARNMEERRHEFAALAALGFRISVIRKMLLAERAVVLTLGLIAGLLPAFIVSIVINAEIFSASILRIATLVATVFLCAFASVAIALRAQRFGTLIETLKLE